MTPPLVSVIIPVFNGERFLAEAIQSVLKQTWSPLEIVVVDDGSTDSSLQVAERFGAAVSRCSQPRSGAGPARNEGVRRAAGSLLAFLDQDDVWLPDKLACQTAALVARPALDAVFGLVRQFRGAPPANLSNGTDSPDLGGYLPSALLIRRQAFERIGPFESGWVISEWTNWYVRAVEARLEMAMLPQLVAWRRLHSANQSLRHDARGEYVRILKASLDRRRPDRKGR